MIVPEMVASNGTKVPVALFNRNSIKASTLVLLIAELSIKRMFSLKFIVRLLVVATLVAAFIGLKVTDGAMVSGPPNVVPSTVKLSKRLFPTVPPEPCENSTFSLKFGLLFAPVIEVKSKVAKAGSPLFGITVVKGT